MQNGVFDAEVLARLQSEGDYLVVMPASRWIGFAGYQWASATLVSNIRAAAKEFKKRTGDALVVTEAFRSLETQNEFRRRWAAGTGNYAAYPGTSNHGWGIAVDLGSGIGYGGEAYRVWSEIASIHGFSNKEGLALVPPEKWHWVVSGVSPAGSTPTPIPIEPEPKDEDVSTIQAVYLDKNGSESSPIYASTGVFTSWSGFEVTSVGRADRGFLAARLNGAAMLTKVERQPDLHVDAAGWEFINSNQNTN